MISLGPCYFICFWSLFLFFSRQVWEQISTWCYKCFMLRRPFLFIYFFFLNFGRRPTGYERATIPFFWWKSSWRVYTLYLYDYGPQSFDQGKSLYLQITTAKGLTYIQCTTSLIITTGLKTLSAELQQEHEMHASVELSSRIVCETVQEDDYTSWRDYKKHWSARWASSEHGIDRLYG